MNNPKNIYNPKKLLVAIIAAGTLAITSLAGCAVTREQSTAGEYVDDATITAKVKTRFVESSKVSASSIRVETLKGSVQLSGFAKSADEKSYAEKLARGVPGVKSVTNDIIVKP